MKYTDILNEINLPHDYKITLKKKKIGTQGHKWLCAVSLSDETEDISGSSVSWAIYRSDHKLAKTMYKCMVN